MPKRSRAQNSSCSASSHSAKANMPRSRSSDSAPQRSYARMTTSVSQLVRNDPPSSSRSSG